MPALHEQTESTHWGADYDAWSHFALTLHLVNDMLPVVSNKTAIISPNSKIKDLGKTPSLYNTQHQVVGIASWTQRVTLPQEIAKWREEPDYGICIQTRKVRAIDIDIKDRGRAEEVVLYIELLLGYSLPKRWRRDSGKCLLTLYMPKPISAEHDFTKRVIHTEHGIIEFLATGQQFIAAGAHTNGEKYQWDHGQLPEAIPDVSATDFELLWAALYESFGTDATEAREGQKPTTTRSLADIDDPMVAFMQDTGWIVGSTSDGRFHIRCPWQHEHTSQTDSSTTYFPAGIGGFQQGHFKCLHSHCIGRTDGQFAAAIGFVAASFEPVTLDNAPNPESTPINDLRADICKPPKVPTIELTRNKNGIINTATNTLRMMNAPEMTGFTLCYDNFRSCAYIRPQDEKVWRPVRDSDYIELQSALERRGMHQPSMQMVKAATYRTAERNQVDTAIQWAQALVWDGTPRIANFFADYFGTADNAYTRAVSMYWWTALAGRVMFPGVQADMTPILVGGQGLGKTQGVKAMAPIPDSYAEIDLAQRDEDQARKMRGKLVCELGELRGLQSRDSDAIKAWISRGHDEWTPKFMEFTTKIYRRCLFIGTVNKDAILDDDEERRWLPMRVGVVNVEKIREDRDQLWAEGLAVYGRDGIAWREAQTLAVNEHVEFKVQDEWRPYIEQWLQSDELGGDSSPKNGVTLFTTAQVLTGAIRIPADRINRREADRVARTLRLIGYDYVNVRVKGYPTPVKRWVKRTVIE